jgi:hypothetical protein
MLFDDGDGHNVEDAAGVSILRVRELFVTPAIVVGFLNLAVDLPAISAVQIDTIFPVCSDGIVDEVVLQVSNSDKFVAERLSCVLRLPNRKGCR